MNQMVEMTPTIPGISSVVMKNFTVHQECGHVQIAFQITIPKNTMPTLYTTE